MPTKYILEAVVDSLESALSAEAAGADRIELCAALEIGGISPSAGLVATVCEQLSIPIYVLLRPRAGGFDYSEGEFQILLRDARLLCKWGVAGIVAGCLDRDRNLDADRTAALMDAAKLPMTFHRAFDRCEAPFDTAEKLAQIGVERILTSGQKSTALSGIDLIAGLVRQVGKSISIMPGGGVSPENVAQIASLSAATEFHFSAIQLRPSDGGMTGPSLGPRDNGNLHFRPFPEKITAIRSALNLSLP